MEIVKEEKVEISLIEQPNAISPIDMIGRINKKLASLNQPKLEDRKEYVIFDGVKPWSYDFTALLGKVFNIAYSIYFKYSKIAKVFKVKESLYVSPTYQPYYQITIKQKEEIESYIRSQLAGIASLVNDYLLALHDKRKYEHFKNIFDKIEKLKKEGKNLKEEESKLRHIFIDQVDIHTGDFSLVNLARTRWPTLIADFLELENETNPKEIIENLKKKNINISMAEAIVLAKKNLLYLSWKSDFEKIVKERYEEISKLVEMRRNSINAYKKLVAPYVKKLLSYQESVPSKTSFFKPASQMEALEETVYWIIKPVPFYFYPKPRIKYEIDAETLGLTKTEIDCLTKKDLSEDEKDLKEFLGVKIENKKVKVGEGLITKAMPIEPSLDRIIRVGIQIINENFGTNFTIADALKIRQDLLAEEEKAGARETLRLSPYYAFIEVSVYRCVLRLPDGTTIEDFSGEVKPFLISQNLAILTLLQQKAIDEWYENQANLFLGEIPREKIMKFPTLLKNSLEEFYQKFLKRTAFYEKYIYESPKWELIAGRYYSDFLVSLFSDIKSTLKSAFNVPF